MLDRPKYVDLEHNAYNLVESFETTPVNFNIANREKKNSDFLFIFKTNRKKYAENDTSNDRKECKSSFQLECEGATGCKLGKA